MIDIEVVIYSLVNLLPYIFVALRPFRNSLRFSNKILLFWIIILSGIQITMGISASQFTGQSVGLLSMISNVSYIVFYFVSVRANFLKALFNIVIIINLANMIVFLSKGIEGIFAYDMAIQTYRITYTIATLFVQVIVLTPIYIYICPMFGAVYEKMGRMKFWRLAWIVPSDYYFVVYYILYFNTDKSALELALDMKNAVVITIVNIVAMLVYYVMIKMVDELDKLYELEIENQKLTTQSIQYENLMERINEARAARHDLRHHVTVIKSYVDSKEYGRLQEYLSSYMETLPDETAILYTENYSLNALIMYFEQVARKNKIQYDVKVNIPKEIKMTDNDITVLWGNLIENAISACSAQKSTERKIKIRADIKNEKLVMTIDNTYENAISFNKKGILLSTKHAGAGVGVESVKGIVDKYKGIYETTYENGIYKVSIMI